VGTAPEWSEVPRQTAMARLERLLALQRRIAAEHLAAQKGKVVEVLVEGPSDRPGERVGRTPENRVVHLAASEESAPQGALVEVKITRAGTTSLSGTLA